MHQELIGRIKVELLEAIHIEAVLVLRYREAQGPELGVSIDPQAQEVLNLIEVQPREPVVIDHREAVAEAIAPQEALAVRVQAGHLRAQDPALQAAEETNPKIN